MSFETVCVVGLGYIGLPTAATFAAKGMRVSGVDIKDAVVDSINSGQAHIDEPALGELVVNCVSSGLLVATKSPQEADVFIIAVPTPLNSQLEPDLDFVSNAVREIAPVLKSGNVVILESTSPVGTTEQISKDLSEIRPDLSFPHVSENPDISICYCPERVLPGNILEELVHNDRVIGGITPDCAEMGRLVYEKISEGTCHLTDAKTAELTKLAENSFRDVNIAFANELSLICDDLGLSVNRLIELTNQHPRVNILKPGPGVGGHCIAIDPWFIVSGSPENSNLIRSARKVNDEKPFWVVRKVLQEVKDTADRRQVSESEIVIACFGLAYKSNVADIRESPAIVIARELSGAHVGQTLLVEPHITKIDGVLDDSMVSLEAALESADILVKLVGHKQFDQLALNLDGNKRFLNFCS